MRGIPVLFFFVLVPVGVLTWLGQVWFLAELKRSQPEKWRSTASLPWIDALSWQSLRFLQAGKYRDLQSPRLRRIGAAVKLLQLSLVATFAAIMLWILWPS